MAIATDNFNRGSLGTSWTNAVGSLTLNSNRITCAASNNCLGFFNDLTFAESQYSQGILTIGTDWVGVAVRVSANNGYQFYVTASNWESLRTVNGVQTVIGSGSRTFATNDVLRLEVERTTLRAYHNGVLVTSINDSSLSSGRPGVSFWAVNQTPNSFLDDWEGGDLHNEMIGRDTFYIRNHPAYRR